MTKISKKSAYPVKVPVEKDYFVGTDSENNGKTVNFDFESTTKLINELTGTSVLKYLFKTSNNIPLEVLTEGVFLSDENETSIEGITKFYVNKKNLYNADLSDLFRFMSTNKNKFLVTLKSSNSLNNTVYFNILAITELADSFTFEVSTYLSNSAFTSLIHFNSYFFNFELKSVGVNQDLQSVLDNGNVSVNVYPEIYDNTNHIEYGGSGVYGYNGEDLDKSTTLNLTNRTATGDVIYEFNPSKSTGTYTIATLDDIPEPTDVSGFVPYTGATTDVDLGEFQIKVGQLELDQTPTGTFGVGKIRWNDTAGTAEIRLKGNNVTLQLGQELVKRVVNKTATNITLLESNYQVVKIIGATGQRLSIDLAQANNDLNSATALGIVTENILNNQEGFITYSGEVNLINTTGSLQGETWADGDVLYLSPTTAGAITNIKPTAPNHTVVVGYVEYSHIVNGKIFVKIDNGYELDELHNVLISAVSNNDILVYENASSIWKNKSITTVLGFTPSNDIDVVKLTTDQTIAGNKTFTDNVNIATTENKESSRYIYFIGDSYTEGTGATPTSNRFSTLTAKMLGYVEVNDGIGGSKLSKRTPDYANFVDRIAAVPTYSTTLKPYVVIAGGFNDAYDIPNSANFTVANYSTDYQTIIDILISKGFPTNHIVVVTPWYSLTGGLSATRLIDFKDAALAIASTNSTLVFDAYTYLQNNQGYELLNAYGDGNHVANDGHRVIAQQIARVIGYSVQVDNQDLAVKGVAEIGDLVYRNISNNIAVQEVGLDADGKLTVDKSGHIRNVSDGLKQAANIKISGYGSFDKDLTVGGAGIFSQDVSTLGNLNIKPGAGSYPAVMTGLLSTNNGVRTYIDSYSSTSGVGAPIYLQALSTADVEVYGNIIMKNSKRLTLDGFFKYKYSYPIPSTNLNSLTEAGFYSGDNFTNAPNSSTGYFYITVENHDNGVDFTHQTATSYGVGNTENEIYSRVRNAGTWSAWKRIVYTDSPALTGTPTAPTATAGTNTTQIATTAFVQEGLSVAAKWAETSTNIQNTNTGNIIMKTPEISILNASNVQTGKIDNTGEFRGNSFRISVFGSGMFHQDSGQFLEFRTENGNSGFPAFNFKPNYLVHNAGTVTVMYTGGNFNPSSPTSSAFTQFHFNPTINQTGGANGITRSLYINPTLTSAADFRAIEVTAGKVIIPDGVGANEAVTKGQLDAISSSNVLTGTTILNFGDEQDSITNTISSLLITNSNIKSVTIIPQESSETSLDDFALNGVSFNIENIIDNVSFDIRGTARNNASGNYAIKYLITY